MPTLTELHTPWTNSKIPRISKHQSIPSICFHDSHFLPTSGHMDIKQSFRTPMVAVLGALVHVSALGFPRVISILQLRNRIWQELFEDKLPLSPKKPTRKKNKILCKILKKNRHPKCSRIPICCGKALKTRATNESTDSAFLPRSPAFSLHSGSKINPLCLFMCYLSVSHHLPFMEGHLFLHDLSAFFPLPSTAGEQDHSSATAALAQISNSPFKGKSLFCLSYHCASLILLLMCLPSKLLSQAHLQIN